MPDKPSSLTRFVGAAMATVGALITLLSGACTGFFLFGNPGFYLFGNPTARREASDLWSVLIILGIGLPFIGLGLALVFGGRAIARGRRPPAAGR